MSRSLRLEPADRETWLAVAEASPAATFFQTPYWSDVAEASGEWVDATLAGTLSDGARVVYPLVARPRRRFARLAAARSSFAGCYGGPIAERPLEDAEAAQLHRAAAAAHPVELRVLLTPQASVQSVPAGFASSTESTFLIDLREGFEPALARFNSGQRGAYRRGEREGLVARRGVDEQDHAAYEAMYEETLRIRGEASTSVYPPGVMAALGRLRAERPDVGLLWLLEHQGTLAMGAYIFRWRDYVVGWHIATTGLRLKTASPFVTLVAGMMQGLVEDGALWFDLNTSGGLEGVEAMKRRLGGDELPARRLTYSRRWAHSALGVVNRVDRLRRAVR